MTVVMSFDKENVYIVAISLLKPMRLMVEVSAP